MASMANQSSIDDGPLEINFTIFGSSMDGTMTETSGKNHRSKSDRRWNRPRHHDALLHRRAVSLYSRLHRQVAFDEEVDAFGEPVTLLNNVIRISETEVETKKMLLKYCTRRDQYKRPTDPCCPTRIGWKSFVFAERNMDLITEHRHQADHIDHVMVYLSRNPGTTSACVKWKFNFTDVGLCVDRFALRFSYETTEDGNMRVYLQREDDTGAYEEGPRIPIFSSQLVRLIPEIQGWSRFSLIAEMSCKRGMCAFNHSQLFLQERSAKLFEKEHHKYPLKIEIDLR